jgi:hypothetical protein
MKDLHRGERLQLAMLAAGACSALCGCYTITSYVDPALPVIACTDWPRVEQHGPVTVLMELRTNGNADARGTSAMSGRVMAAITASGMFSGVSTDRGPEVGILKIVIDNVGEDSQGEQIAKGLVTAFTVGLVGSLFTDYYICSAAYSFNGTTTETTVRHALHSTIGLHSSPPGMTAMKVPDAVDHVFDQLVWHALKQLDELHAFGTASAEVRHHGSGVEAERMCPIGPIALVDRGSVVEPARGPERSGAACP